MNLFSQFSAHFWLLFSLAVSIAVIRELRRTRDEPPMRLGRRKKR
ncbi:hypothetical protein [Pseudomonas sp. UBA2684]|nr:hypothetical protein [Pseudomonas sp. UBA2684]|tara:strand:- start:2697 stop:2831 length:135 start_codon:yes stop_codon:yes gene_type:complete